MAKFTRIQVAQKMAEQGMVPLFYHSDIDLAKKALNAAYAGGARLLEFTNRGDFAHEVFGALTKYARRELPELMMGVGSVQDAGTASLYIQLGADFVVMPNLREDVALTCNRRKILWAAGCGTLSEIGRAEELGAEIVKVFPGSTLGPAFVKAIKGPCPWTSIMPTGGVSPTKENLQAWFDAGVTCVGMGSKLMRKDWIKAGKFSEITTLVRETLAMIEEIRQTP